MLAYRLGANELDIDAEMDLDIREAPVTELFLRVPKGYALARLTAGGAELVDHFLREPAGESTSELRLVFNASRSPAAASFNCASNAMPRRMVPSGTCRALMSSTPNPVRGYVGKLHGRRRLPSQHLWSCRNAPRA